MIIQFDDEFTEKLKHVDVRKRKSVKDALKVFTVNPFAPELDNHQLKNNFSEYRSIDAEVDYRVLYKEKIEGGEAIAYFTTFGTHQELYG